MKTAWSGLRAASLTALALALALATGLGAQSTGSSTSPSSTPAAQPAPGTTPVAGDASQTDAAKQTPAGTAHAGTSSPGTNAPAAAPSADPAPGTAPVAGDTPPGTSSKKPAPGTTPVSGDVQATDVNPEKVIEPGSQKVNVKPGSIEDVSAVGNRDIGARGLGNWYSVDTEIKMGKMYSMEIEKSTKFINDPVVEEYVNRIG